MSVPEMERRFYELKGRLDVGAIDEEEFKSEIERLRFQDGQNRWWMIGAQSGRWYMYDGARWIPGQPPIELLPPDLPPESGIPLPPAPVPVAATRETTSPPESAINTPGTFPSQSRPAGPSPTAPPAPAPVPPPQATYVPRPPRKRRSRTAFRPQVTAPVLIGCAGLAAILLVLMFWWAVETFVPGKPISTALARMTGIGKPPATATPRAGTPVAASSGITPLINAGDDFVLNSQFDPAIAQYQAAAQTAQSNPLPLSRWSRALALRGQIDEALAKANQATVQAPNDAEAQAQLSHVLSWTGQVPQAIVAGEKAVQLDPKNWNARAYLAEAYLLTRRSADAQSQAQMALQLSPQSAEAHRAQAWVLTLIGQRDAALVEWRQTIALEPNLSFRHFELGEVLRVFYNDPINAAAEYQKAIALYGGYVPAYGRLGLAFLDANQPQQAILQFQRTVTLDPGNPDGYAYLGLAFGKASQCAQGIPYFQQALKISPNHPIAAKGLSDCSGGKVPSAPASPAPTIPLVPPAVRSQPSAAPKP